MSFILDALRKSETERQRKSGPGLIDAGYRPPATRRAVWLPILVVVLLANLVAMGVFWLRRDGAATPATATADVRPAPPVASAPTAEPVRPAAGPPEPSDEDFAGVADMPALEPERAAAAEAAISAALHQAAQAEPAPAENAHSGIVQEGLPTAEQLTAEGKLNVPPLHLDMHVFSPQPAGRFVFINLRKYTEGAVLAEGPTVEEITREGVVLSLDGRRFILSRD